MKQIVLCILCIASHCCFAQYEVSKKDSAAIMKELASNPVWKALIGQEYTIIEQLDSIKHEEERRIDTLTTLIEKLEQLNAKNSAAILTEQETAVLRMCVWRVDDLRMKNTGSTVLILKLLGEYMLIYKQKELLAEPILLKYQAKLKEMNG
jgi:hypothetical protein